MDNALTIILVLIVVVVFYILYSIMQLLLDWIRKHNRKKWEKIVLIQSKVKKAALFLIAIIFILTTFIHINHIGRFKTNKEKIKGVWETTGDIVFSPPVSTNRFLDRFYKSRKSVELTFHENGQVSSSGKICGRYEFTGKSSISYRSGRDIFNIEFYTIDFPTKNEMIWYIDSNKRRSFNRVRE